MSKREERMGRIVGVYHEYLAATLAADLLDVRLQADPAYLSMRDLRGRVARNLRNNLEGTFLIRLFAEFEAGLRDAWENAFHRPTEPPMRDLLDAIAAKRLITRDWLDHVHRVRLFRNALVHQGGTGVEPVAIHESRDHLRRFLSKLPTDW